MREYTGQIAALLTTFCWVGSTLCFSSAGRRVGSLSVNIIRLAIAWCFFAAYGALVRGLPLPTDASGQAWLWLSLSGFVGFFLGDLCLFKALVIVGPRISTLLMSLAPPIGALAAMPVLGERLSAWNWLGMLVTLAGVCWVVIERRVDENGVALHPSAGGIVLGLLAAAGQAFGSVLSKVGMGDYDAFAAAQIRVLTGLTCFAVLLAILRWYPRVRETMRNGRAMALITMGSLTGPFLGVALFLIAIRHIEIGVAQTIVSLMPVLIIPFVIVLHKERVTWRAVTGAVVAVAGVALLFWK